MAVEIIQEPIRQRTFIAATPETVFDTITSAEGWNAFFTTGMELQAKPDGRIVFRWDNWGPDHYTLDAPGKVLEVTPPNRFVFQWGRKPTTITFDLEPADGGTILEITEVGYTNTLEGRRHMLECACGWGEAATLLKFWLEHGVVYGRVPRATPASA
jgi:uncharacterized protein YndB with AHSA1/START domain